MLAGRQTAHMLRSKISFRTNASNNRGAEALSSKERILTARGHTAAIAFWWCCSFCCDSSSFCCCCWCRWRIQTVVMMEMMNDEGENGNRFFSPIVSILLHFRGFCVFAVLFTRIVSCTNSFCSQFPKFNSVTACGFSLQIALPEFLYLCRHVPTIISPASECENILHGRWWFLSNFRPH